MLDRTYEIVFEGMEMNVIVKVECKLEKNLPSPDGKFAQLCQKVCPKVSIGFYVRKITDDLDKSSFSGQMTAEASYKWVEE